ncbi:MAG TPA: serine/threonine-protein kinase [Terriglobales bacterium]|nr:serine/threonine-protein kinase [Terriglobales bacterium]
MGLRDLLQLNTKSVFSDWTRRFSGVILYILITFLVMVLYLDQQSWLEKFNLKFQDLGYKFRGKIDSGNELVILSIDRTSLDKYGRWPWSRDKLAALVEKISSAKPKVIYLDFYLPSDPVEDTSGRTGLLSSSIRNAGNVILPLYFNFAEVGLTPTRYPDILLSSTLNNIQDREGLSYNLPYKAREVYYPDQTLAEAACALGYANQVRDLDKKVRHESMIVAYDDNYYPSVCLQIVRRYLNLKMEDLKVETGGKIYLKDTFVPMDNKWRFSINYDGPPGSFRYCSAASLLDGSSSPDLFFRKIVLVGLTDLSTSQLMTPVSSSFPSVEKTACVVENLLHKNFLKTSGFLSILDFLVLVLIGCFCAFVLPNVNLIQRLVILFVFLFVILNLSFILFSSFHMITKPFYPLLELLLFLVVSPGIKSQKASVQKTREEEEIKEQVAIQERFIPAEPEPEKTMQIDMSGQIKEKTPTPVSLTPPRTLEETPTPKVQKSTSQVSINQFGRYKVQEIIGRGAMGTVYKGVDPAIDRLVALKTIRLDTLASPDEMSELVDRLVKEAQAAGRLSHPNIVTIYDVGQEGDLYYIAMEYLQGYTLDKMIQKKSEMNYKIVAKIMIQACQALSYAHDKGIIHRDIKPANIMILDNFDIKVMDFGIARLGGSATMTQTGIAMGTPSYIAPEILQGKTADKRSDIFSLGVVLYEILAGQKPFKGETISALIYSILNDQPMMPSAINEKTPTLFDRIVGKALEKVTENRYQNASEMETQLKEFLSSFVVSRTFKI